MYKILLMNGDKIHKTKFYQSEKQFDKYKKQHLNRYKCYTLKCYQYTNDEWKEV